MRRFLLAVLICGAMTGAHAADMPDLPVLRGGFFDDGPAQPTRWAGFYVGAQGGYGTSDMNFSGSTRDVAAHLLSGLAMEQEQGISNWPIMRKVSTHGNGFGGFLGYNWQWDDVVIGAELSYIHGKFGGSQTDSMGRSFTLSNGYTDGVTYQGTARMSISDMGSIRARAGYAFGSFLPYAFAGVALGQGDIVRTARVYGVEVNVAAAPGFTNIPFDLSATDAKYSRLLAGYSFGLGFDVQLISCLFFRAEWEYLRFATVVDTSINTVRVGVGYKF